MRTYETKLEQLIEKLNAILEDVEKWMKSPAATVVQLFVPERLFTKQYRSKNFVKKFKQRKRRVKSKLCYLKTL